jgi:hypothetical protein
VTTLHGIGFTTCFASLLTVSACCVSFSAEQSPAEKAEEDRQRLSSEAAVLSQLQAVYSELFDGAVISLVAEQSHYDVDVALQSQLNASRLQPLAAAAAAVAHPAAA